MECLGVSSARSDVEVIALAWDLLAALGVKGWSWRSTVSGLEDRQRYRAQLVAWLQEQADQLDSDSQERLLTNPCASSTARPNHSGAVGRCPHSPGGFI